MPKYHYVSRRYYKPWTDNALRVCVLPQQYIMPFKTPSYWNDDNKKTLTSNIAVKNNYSFTEENENKITAIEESGHDIIESILKNKVLPNKIGIDPLYKLIALFLSNNPTFRGGIKNALNENRENIIAALQASITPQDKREFFMAEIKNVNPLSDTSLQIADEALYPHIKENFRFHLLRSHPKKSFITSETPVILISPSNNHPIFNIGWRITKFTWFYENGAMGSLEVNLNNEGKIKGFTLRCPDSFDEPTQSTAHISCEYHFLELNIHQIYFPISPQLALHGVNTKYGYNEPILLMLSENQTLEFNSWGLSHISDYSKTKAVGGNYGILEQSAIYHNSKNTTGPRYIS